MCPSEKNINMFPSSVILAVHFSIHLLLRTVPALQCDYFGSAEIALFEWMIYK